MKTDKKIYYDPVKVGQRIKKLRKDMGMTQWELAEEIHISRDMLSRIENGKNNCAPDYLMHLSQRFDKTVEYFFFGEEYEKQPLTRLEIMKEIEEMLRKLDKKHLYQIYQVIKLLNNDL